MADKQHPEASLEAFSFNREGLWGTKGSPVCLGTLSFSSLSFAERLYSHTLCFSPTHIFLAINVLILVDIKRTLFLQILIRKLQIILEEKHREKTTGGKGEWKKNGLTYIEYIPDISKHVSHVLLIIIFRKYYPYEK